MLLLFGSSRRPLNLATRHSNEASAADQFLDATTAESLDALGVAPTEAGALFPISLETCFEYAVVICGVKHGQKLSRVFEAFDGNIRNIICFLLFFVLIVSDYPAQKGFIFGEYVGILEGPCDPGILEMVKLSFLTLFLDMVAFESSRFLVPF